MQNQPDWGKRGVYAAYIIGIPTLLLGAFAYFRPPDPAHPIGFDFLFRTVQVPIWLLILLLVIAIVLALAFRLLSPRIRNTIVEEGPVRKIEPFRPITPVQSPQKPLLQFEAPAKSTDIVIETNDQLKIHVKTDNSSDVRGVTLLVANDRLDAIHELDVIVYSAYSFDSRHGQFRTHAAATGARMRPPNVVPPSESSPNVVLLHCPAGRQFLSLGDDDSRVMKWPENDKATVQRWKLSVSVGARAYSRTVPPTGEVFQPERFDLIVDWDTKSNKLSVEKA